MQLSRGVAPNDHLGRRRHAWLQQEYLCCGAWLLEQGATHWVEVAHISMKNGKPTIGEYEDLVNAEGGVWGRLVGIATAKDGALIILDDGTSI